MPSIASDTTATVLVDFQAVRAARMGHQTPRGADVAARIFMACLALLCLVFVSSSWRGPRPRRRRTTPSLAHVLHRTELDPQSAVPQLFHRAWLLMRRV